MWEFIILFVIGTDQHRRSDVPNRLLDKGNDRPLDIAETYVSLSGYS